MAGRTFNPRILLAFFIGLSMGVTLSLIAQYTMRDYSRYRLATYQLDNVHDDYDPDISRLVTTRDDEGSLTPVGDGHREALAERVLRLDDEEFRKFLSANRTHEQAHLGEDELAREMFKKIRILCWVMTQPKNHESRAKTVKETWGKRCNVLYFVSTEAVAGEITAIYPGGESRDILWGKTKLGFKYAYDHYYDDADWFVKADDDTYLIMENMRLMLLDKDPATPVHYGCKFKPIVKQGYMSGGAGYVLSKEALRRFIEEGLPDKKKCKQEDSGIEDGRMGDCLQNVGVAVGDSRDQEGRARFFPFVPQSHVNDKVDKSFWYWQYISFMHDPGVECCSDSSISFHYVDPRLMRTLEFLIYHVHPFGIDPQLTGSTIKKRVFQYLNYQPVDNGTKTTNINMSINNSTDVIVKPVEVGAKEIVSDVIQTENDAKDTENKVETVVKVHENANEAPKSNAGSGNKAESGRLNTTKTKSLITSDYDYA